MKCCLNARILLLVLLLLAGWGRWISASHVFDTRYNPKKSLYFDEVVYIALGQNVLNRGDYSLRMQYENMKKIYTKIPQYVNDTLFKHPPLVPMMVGLSMKLFSNNIRAAFLPGIVLGTAILGLVFILARRLFHDRWAPWMAVLLLAVSPTHWICCARIILEAPLAFFILAGVTAQCLSVRCPKLRWLSVVAWSLAWWTKYTAIPIWAIFQVFMLCAYPRLLKSRCYWLTQIALFALYLPWVLMRLHADGAGFFLFWQSRTEEWRSAAALLCRPAVWIGLILFSLAMVWLIGRRRQVLPALMRSEWAQVRAIPLAWMTLALLGAVAMLEPATISFRLLPWSGANDNLLSSGPVWTYFLRLVWFEPVTLLGMASIFFLPGPRQVQVIKGLALVGTIAITAWGNYQMRYLLPVIPFWEIVSVGALVFFYRKIRVHSQPAAVLFVGSWLGWSLLRSAWMVWHIAIPNDVFYF